jgi:uncharacterized protein (DUF433 family)
VAKAAVPGLERAPERVTMTDMASRPRLAGLNKRRLYLPAYRFSEAARLAETTPQTVTRWYYGYAAPGHQMDPVLPSDGSSLLSYLQLVEVAFVATFRKQDVRLDTLRRAHEYSRKTFNSEHPFAELKFTTDGVHVFHTYARWEDSALQREEPLVITTDAGGQLAWGEAIEERIRQFDYEKDLALRWHPRGRKSVIVVDPQIAFGAPIISGSGVPTWVIKDRYEAGETLREIEGDFDVPLSHLQEALIFEDVALPSAA